MPTLAATGSCWKPGRVVAARDEFLRFSLRDSGASSGARSPRIVRIYAIHEDGTLVSLPWVDHPGDATESNLLNVELATLSTRANLPAFAPEDFFFRSATESYSGFYLDLGGRGLVSTLIAPLSLPGLTTHSVLAMDLAFDIDWAQLAVSLESPIRGAAVYIVPGTSTSWSALGQQLPDFAAAELRRAVSDAAVSVGPSARDNDAPMRHALVANGAVAAFRVSDRQWLLAWFPQVAPAFPFSAVALLSALLVLLLTGFEVNRRRAMREQRTAEREFQEKQNLLNTMQVPLVVVDPNTDAIVSANRAADAMGFTAGRRFADLVWPDARAREHYQRMQIASPEPRRAYGVPVSVPGAGGQPERRYAVVRSVAVTAPIEALNADERHRLGVLVVLDESSDLQLLLEDTDAAAHRDERRRLAGLLSHGVDTLARVLEYSLSRSHDPAFTAWLSGYLERRVGVTAWLLDHWDAQPPLPPRKHHRCGAGARDLRSFSVRAGARGERARSAATAPLGQRHVVRAGAASARCLARLARRRRRHLPGARRLWSVPQRAHRQCRSSWPAGHRAGRDDSLRPRSGRGGLRDSQCDRRARA